jgi:aspartate aminotransferase
MEFYDKLSLLCRDAVTYCRGGRFLQGVKGLGYTMSIVLAERVSRLKASASIAAQEQLARLAAAGLEIVDLTIGEPCIDTAPHIVSAAIAAMKAGDTHYTPAWGKPALREAISRKLKRENGLDYDIGQIVVGCGAKQLTFEAFAATLSDGDEVIIPAPYWLSYPEIVRVNGGTPVFVECGENVGFKLQGGALERAITPQTRWLILNSPNNPTGAVYSRDELADIARVLARHLHVCVLVDEIYEHLTFDGKISLNVVQVDPLLSSRTLLINGLSKAYAMTGWRVGYAAGPVALVAAIAKLLGQTTSCASSISQTAGVAALDGDQAHVLDAVRDYGRKRDRMMDLLRDAPGLRFTRPDGAFYLYPSVAGLIGRRTPTGQALETDSDVASYLLDHGVAVLAGSPYGLSPYLRLSFATSLEAIEQGCRRIVEACSQVQ